MWRVQVHECIYTRLKKRCHVKTMNHVLTMGPHRLMGRCTVYIDYFMVGERVRFLFTSCGKSQTNERVFERVSL